MLQSSLSYWTWRYETLRMRLKREGENENPAGLLGFVDEDEAGVVMEKGVEYPTIQYRSTPSVPMIWTTF